MRKVISGLKSQLEASFKYVLNIWKGYQTFDTVSSAVTTKVKGQGFVPVNLKKDVSLNDSDPHYYDRLFSLDVNKKYKILDTAGMYYLFQKLKKFFDL